MHQETQTFGQIPGEETPKEKTCKTCLHGGVCRVLAGFALMQKDMDKPLIDPVSLAVICSWYMEQNVIQVAVTTGTEEVPDPLEEERNWEERQHDMNRMHSQEEGY